MIHSTCDPADKLAILRQQDSFRDWQSLDDKRVCVLCEKQFSGHDVIVSADGSGYELRCPTGGCHSHVHQWIYPLNPLISDKTSADWWQALGNSKPTQVA